VLGLPLPIEGPTRFALAGNRISDNAIRGSRLAIALAGDARSVNDCVQDNHGAPTEPADLRQFSCVKTTTPSLPLRAGRHLIAFVARLQAQLAAHIRHHQPTPPPQPTMPTPCRGAPPTPLCPR